MLSLNEYGYCRNYPVKSIDELKTLGLDNNLGNRPNSYESGGLKRFESNFASFQVTRLKQTGFVWFLLGEFG